MKSGLVLAASAIAATATATVVSAYNLFAPPKSQNSAREAYTSSLLGRARPIATNSRQGLRRQIEESVIANGLSEYSLRFEKCQFIKTWDDEFSAADPSEVFLAMKNFVVFRLCPSSGDDDDDDCDDSCDTNFGEYVVDMEGYLEETVRYQRDKREERCEACNSVCFDEDGNVIESNIISDVEIEIEEEESISLGDIEAVSVRNINGGRGGGFRRIQDSGVDCDICVNECMMYENMEENGYFDATEFIKCTMVYDPDVGLPLYAGPVCASLGSKINIGIFTDSNCRVPDSDKNVEDYIMDEGGINSKLSHALLKKTYSTDCISCRDGKVDFDAGFDLCENLHSSAAKCEQENENLKYAYTTSQNQLAQEGEVCDFINTLKLGIYDEGGEIFVDASNVRTTIKQEFTRGNQIAIAFLAVGVIALSFYAVALRRATNPNAETPGRSHERETSSS